MKVSIFYSWQSDLPSKTNAEQTALLIFEDETVALKGELCHE